MQNIYTYIKGCIVLSFGAEYS